MPLVVFPSLAYVYGTGVLPKITMFIDKQKVKLQNIVANSLSIIEFFLFSLLTYFSWVHAMKAYDQLQGFTAGGEFYPLYPVLFFVPLGFGLLTLEIVFTFIKNVKQKPVSSRIVDK